jgi:hypothetical protein
MQRKVFKLMATLGLAAAAFVSSAATAEASFVLRLTSGATVITIDDATDAAPNNGAVNYAGDINGFTVNILGGLSEPATTDPIMNLTYQIFRTGGSGDLLIELTDSNYSFLPSSLGTTFNTTAESGTVRYSAYYDSASAEFSTANAIVVNGSSPLDVVGGGPGGPGSLYFRVNMVGATGTNSGDASIYNAPEPTTMALFGMALLGLGGAVRRRFTA